MGNLVRILGAAPKEKNHQMEKMNFLLFFFLKLPLLIKGLEHCCKKKEVGGITYTLKRVAEGDLHLQYNCLNNCVYQQKLWQGYLLHLWPELSKMSGGLRSL